MKKVKQLTVIMVFLVAVFLCSAGAIAIIGTQDRIANADMGLVLGSKVETDGTPSRRLKARLEEGRRLYASGCIKKIIVSGGKGREGFWEGSVMRDYLVNCGISPDDIIVDNFGDNTEKSAANAACILRKSSMTSIIVVSQYFHIPRAKLALQRAGVKVVLNAHPDFFELRDIYSLIREVPACVKYIVTSNRTLSN